MFHPREKILLSAGKPCQYEIIMNGRLEIKIEILFILYPVFFNSLLKGPLYFGSHYVAQSSYFREKLFANMCSKLCSINLLGFCSYDVETFK